MPGILSCWVLTCEWDGEGRLSRSLPRLGVGLAAAGGVLRAAGAAGADGALTGGCTGVVVTAAGAMVTGRGAAADTTAAAGGRPPSWPTRGARAPGRNPAVGTGSRGTWNLPAAERKSTAWSQDTGHKAVQCLT